MIYILYIFIIFTDGINNRNLRVEYILNTHKNIIEIKIFEFRN